MDAIDLTCRDFVSVLASKEPTPGGGGASALAGAVGMALGGMVGSLTLGKKKYAHVQEDIAALTEAAARLQGELLALVARDAEVFAPLARAYGLPKDTPEQQAAKAAALEEATLAACGVPIEIMEKCCEAIRLQAEFARKGAAIAISDAGVGVALCRAALQGASLNVFINTKGMADRARAERLNERANAMLGEYIPLADETYALVAARFT